MFALLKKEIYRFSSIWVQTIIGPMSTALLYQLIFGSQFKSVHSVSGVDYASFLIPGLITMQVLLNSFGNSSSSLIQSKYTGNIIFILMAPISHLSTYAAYLISSVLRGIVVGLAVLLAIIWFGNIVVNSWIALILFIIIGASITSGLGIIAGILCEKFDQLAGFQSFVMVPLVYLSGVFFNINNLTGFWYHLAKLDPFLYIVEGFRYGFINNPQFNFSFSLGFVIFCSLLINTMGFYLLKRGINIKR